MNEGAGRSLGNRICEDIEQAIMSGDWGPGHRVPSEQELMAQYRCSRMTVNRALAPLAERGMIARRKRAGTLVATPAVHRAALDILDIRAEVLSSGAAHRFEMPLCEVRAASDGDCFLLNMAGGTVLALECLHFADERPHALEQRLINCVLVPEAAVADFEV